MKENFIFDYLMTTPHATLTYKNNLIFVISAPSGTGKTSLCREIQASLDHVVPSVSMTTRTARAHERHGEDYFFVSHEVFHAQQAEGRLIEWTQIYDHYYGTPVDPILHNLQKGKDVVCVLDYAGQQALKNYPELMDRVISVFIAPPHFQALKSRLEERGQDAPEVISRRLSESEVEMRQWVYYDYIVFNDDFSVAISEISAIICAEKLRKERQHQRVGEVVATWNQQKAKP